MTRYGHNQSRLRNPKKLAVYIAVLEADRPLTVAQVFRAMPKETCSQQLTRHHLLALVADGYIIRLDDGRFVKKNLADPT